MSPAARHHPPLAADEFISKADLRAWIDAGACTQSSWLLVTPDGQRYHLREAVRVLGRASGDTDPFGFVGMIDTVHGLIERGFAVSAEHVALGRRVYHVEHGWLAEPLASADRSGINPSLG
jgi:hypothetical protein